MDDESREEEGGIAGKGKVFKLLDGPANKEAGRLKTTPFRASVCAMYNVPIAEKPYRRPALPDGENTLAPCRAGLK